MLLLFPLVDRCFECCTREYLARTNDSISWYRSPHHHIEHPVEENWRCWSLYFTVLCLVPSRLPEPSIWPNETTTRNVLFSGRKSSSTMIDNVSKYCVFEIALHTNKEPLSLLVLVGRRAVRRRYCRPYFRVDFGYFFCRQNVSQHRTSNYNFTPTKEAIKTTMSATH